MAHVPRMNQAKPCWYAGATALGRGSALCGCSATRGESEIACISQDTWSVDVFIDGQRPMEMDKLYIQVYLTRYYMILHQIMGRMGFWRWYTGKKQGLGSPERKISLPTTRRCIIPDSRCVSEKSWPRPTIIRHKAPAATMILFNVGKTMS